jgi:hypothetical protein
VEKEEVISKKERKKPDERTVFELPGFLMRNLYDQ